MTDGPKSQKIIVDEDWKAQVEAEKEKVRRGSEATASTDPVMAGASTPRSSSAAEPPDELLPPPSFAFLLTTLATQAMIALGQIPNPITGKADVRLQQAKHYIDTLAMLEQKTAGNRTPEESALLEDLLHQLRMAYVVMQTMPSASAGQPDSQ